MTTNTSNRIIDTVRTFMLRAAARTRPKWVAPFEVTAAVIAKHGSTSESTVTARMRELRNAGFALLRRRRGNSRAYEYLLVSTEKLQDRVMELVSYLPTTKLGVPSLAAAGLSSDQLSPATRLRFLALHLERNVDDEQFNVEQWGGPSTGPHCGTPGCVLGHSVTLFPDLLRWYGEERLSNGEVLSSPCLIEDDDDARTGSSLIGERLFHIRPSESSKLFHSTRPAANTRPAKVAELRALADTVERRAAA